MSTEDLIISKNSSNIKVPKYCHAQVSLITKNYKLNGVSLAETSSTTYFGVELSADMKWNTHVKKTAAKGNQMLGVLRRNLKNCPRNLKDLAYKSILRPKLEYASSVWVPYTAENINKLEEVQRRSARFVCNKYSRKESVTSMLDDLEDCYKYSFVPRSIVQWNNINAPDDHAQFKSMLSLIDLRIGGDTYKY